MSVKKFTPEKISELKENEVFVFGSNVQGEHVGGAALVAYKCFGAVMANGFGLQGNSYAIPTCVRLTNENGNRYTKPFSKVEHIKPFVESFIDDAKLCDCLDFYVTKIGCGIAGFKVSEVAELFRPCLYMNNVFLPKEFVEWLLYPVVIDNLSKRGYTSGVEYDEVGVMRFVMERISCKHSLDDILDEFESLPNI